MNAGKKWKCRLVVGIVSGLLAGCSGVSTEVAAGTVSPLRPSATASGTEISTETPIPTAESKTPTLRPTLTRIPSETPMPPVTPWPEGFTPTARATPTAGMPPVATSAPPETCPVPTGASLSVERLPNPADYEAQALDWLAANGGLSAFAESLNGQSDTIAAREVHAIWFPEDVDNDTTEESILSIHQRYEAEGVAYGPFGTHYRTALWIFGCRENLYATLHTIVLDRSEVDLPSGLLAVEDLNGNGIPEIVVSTVENIGNHGGQNLFAKVLEWNGAAFRETLFPEIQILQSSRTLDSVVEFRDVDGNGTKEILVPMKTWADGTGVDCEFGPDRDSSAVWMWDGEYYQYMWRAFSAPEYRFQAAYDGDYQVFLGLHDRAEISYLRAVFDESLRAGSTGDWLRDGGCPQAGGKQPDPTESIRIQAYARFRLVELFVWVGRVMEAESHRSYLRVNYPLGNPGYIYAYLANTFWWEYVKQEDVGAACAAVRKEAGAFEADVFSVFGQYGLANPGPTLDSLCPFAEPPAE